jgi:hypothetical protein
VVVGGAVADRFVLELVFLLKNPRLPVRPVITDTSSPFSPSPVTLLGDIIEEVEAPIP